MSGRLPRAQKGKAVATSSSPARDVDGGSLDDFDLIHREAMMDTRNMDLPQRVLVSDAARLHREERARPAAAARACSRDGQGGARARDYPPRIPKPTILFSGGVFEVLPALHPDLLRPVVVDGQSWKNVGKTRSTGASVRAILRTFRGTRVTYLIPSDSQRPWTPPRGFQCIYESYFRDDTRLWFPILRLVTAYSCRRDAAISQFLKGSFRIAVILMVMAAEAGVTLTFMCLKN